MVGQSAEPAGAVSDSPRRRSGMALPATLAAITAVSVLISGIWVIVDLNAKTSVNRRSALNAMLVAEAGNSHALALLRGDLRNTNFTKLLKGSDSVASNADDGLFIGYGLSTDKTIPAAGVAFGAGTYSVTIEDDPADTDGNAKEDMNNRLMLRCRGVTPDGASAELLAIIGVVPLPAMATEGRLNIGGNPTVKGQCGGVHANEVVQATGGSITVDGPVTASDTVKATACQIRKLDGTCNVPLNNQPPIDIPILTMAGVCLAPTLRFSGTGVITNAAGVVQPAGTGGWTWSSAAGGKWSNSAAAPMDGTMCFDEDVEISGSPGDDGAPWRVSIYSTKAVKVTGSAVMTAFDPDGGLIIAEGDVSIAGTPGPGFNYGGMIYAGSQCELRGNAKINGQVLCKDGADPAGSQNYVNTTNTDNTGDVSGNPEITFNCTGSVLSKRRIISWVQKLGT
jgi:hypothetical protein